MANNYPNNQVRNDEIDLLELFYVLWRRIIIIIIAAVIGAGGAFVATKMLITPLYQSSAMIYIFSKTTSITSVADLQIGSNLSEDFTVIATTRDVVESVIDELNLDTTYEKLKDTIEVSEVTDTHIIKITCTNENPELAAEISNSLANKLREQIAEIMNTDKPSMVESAIPPEKPSSPNATRNGILGGLVLALIVCAIIIIRHLMDDTIKDEDDVKKYLGVETIAAIPLSRNASSGKSSKNKKHKHKH